MSIKKHTTLYLLIIKITIKETVILHMYIQPPQSYVLFHTHPPSPSPLSRSLTHPLRTHIYNIYTLKRYLNYDQRNSIIYQTLQILFFFNPHLSHHALHRCSLHPLHSTLYITIISLSLQTHVHQNGHQPIYNWLKFSWDVACTINRST